LLEAGHGERDVHRIWRNLSQSRASREPARLNAPNAGPTGPGGTGNRVRISGYEDWKIGADGLIADSKGHYDAQDWDRQVQRQ
jgi:hypothetical protein